MSACLIAALLGTLCNPYGWKMYSVLFIHAGEMNALTAKIIEWMPSRLSDVRLLTFWVLFFPAAALAACFMWLARPAAGLEISLEENRGESGSIGYVDIERVFSQHPGTLKARDEFSKELRMREELLARKKEEIYAIKAEINKLRQEREFLRCLPAVVTPPQKNGTAVLPVSTGTAISSAAMRAETIFRALEKEFAKDGIALVSSSKFLGSMA